MDEPQSTVTLEPTLSIEVLDALGQRLSDSFSKFEKDRKTVEIQWAKNYRQYKGVYDADVNIPDDQSKAYPKLTRIKVVTMVSRLMDMLFPQNEKNWGLKVSPVPDISTEDLQTVLDTLQNQQQQQMQQQAIQQGQQPPPAQPLDSDVIEKAVIEFAKKRMQRLDDTITDQLFESKYEELVRSVVRSGVRYGAGVLKGPFNRKSKSRKWTQDATGRYVAIERIIYRPIFEFVPLWDYYPDLTAKTWETMSGQFQRHVMDYHNVLDLVDRGDFMGTRIRKYLKDNPDGNWQEKAYEVELRTDSADRQNVDTGTTSKYELLEWWGRVKGSELRAAGQTIADADTDKMIEASIWIIGNVVIKAAINPFKGRISLFHQFVFEEDDASLTGEGLPNVMRDSQMAACAATRMLLDNASVVCGPILEMNQELLMPGQQLSPHARKVYYREGIGAEANHPAVREIRIDSHITELTSIFSMFKSLADEETVSPPQSVGNVASSGSGKEAFRTAQGTSMLLGAAALPTRDIVRNFDRFTESVINAMIEWNMLFNDDPEIRGDFQPIARGSTSLMAKEIRAQALDQLAYTMSPEDRKLVKGRELLKERLIVRDLGTDILKDQDQVDAETAAEQQQMAQDKQLHDMLQQAGLKEILSKTARNQAQADKTEASIQTDQQRTMTDTYSTVGSMLNDATGHQPAG